jgi:glycyl-tRNA synthetase
VDGEKRVVLGFHPSIAPIKISVFPLVNNKAELTEKAKKLYNNLQMRYMCEWDTSGAFF